MYLSALAVNDSLTGIYQQDTKTLREGSEFPYVLFTIYGFGY
jgi:hypothetical protein